ncbi:PHD-type domain-containing protein [Aphis craccivora]|uniref:PHD-type domain-containing protein n=1 Tax=Aphis craccivora TaxID=307492 RepID=A0A6G0VRI7_APHCR|nr:PHD-type domain-containing protein [Aphis craccivora]
MPCTKCNLMVSPNKRAICSLCSNDFHTACTNLKTQTNFNNVKDSWKCETCTSKLKNVARKKLDSENYNLDSVKIYLNIVMKKMKSLSNNIKSISFCSDSVDDFNIKLEVAVKKISDIENIILIYEHKCNRLEKEVIFLKTVINNNEQIMLCNNIEISGIPETANDNITEVVKTLAHSLKCDVKDCDIIDAFRGKAYMNMDGEGEQVIKIHNLKTLQKMNQNKKISELWDSGSVDLKSPSLAINNFLMGVDSYLSDISINDQVIICGDMNINILDKSSEVSTT